MLKSLSVRKKGSRVQKCRCTSDCVACVVGSECAAVLTGMVQEAWRARRVPAGVGDALMVYLYKNKGDRADRNNYRGITLVLFVWRIFMRLLMAPHVIVAVEAVMPETQSGGRPGRGCQDQLFALRLLQEEAMAARLPLYAAFVDLAKAFDSIQRPLLYMMFRALGLPALVVELFESMYGATTCAVRVGAAVGERFSTSVGVQQGCLSGSWAFCLYIHFCMEPIMGDLAELGVRIVYRLRDGRRVDAASVALRGARAGALHFMLAVLFIIDDTTLVADSAAELQRGLELLYVQFRRFGLAVNVAKSFAMAFGGVDGLACPSCGSTGGARATVVLCDGCDAAWHLACAGLEHVPEGEWRCAACAAAPAPRPSVLHPPLVVAGAELRWAETDRYLGVTLSACGGLEREVTARIRQARAAFAVLRPMLEACSSSPSDCVRAAFCDAFSATVSAVMLYGAGVWALPAAELERLEVCQCGMLRAALPRAERRRWAARQQRAPREVLYRLFPVPTVATQLARAQLHWLGHVLRMAPERMPRMLLDGRRAAIGPGAGKGCSYPSLMGVYGRLGVYQELVDRFLLGRAATARREIFDMPRERDVAVLAKDKNKWQQFIRSVIV